MTDYMPPLPPEDDASSPARLPFSQMAIWGFVLSCVSIFVFGIIGALGVALSGRGLRAVRQGTARGRGLAIAGMIIGAVGFLYYVISFIIRAL